MRDQNVERTEEVLAYVEAHLHERLNLERVAKGVHYSKYHLHRMFTHTMGMTLHDYIQRRRLTKAARLLVDSRKSILEIAFLAGFESQQAFTDRFKAMYKQTPGKYREQGKFYPLQLAVSLNRNFSPAGISAEEISYAAMEDISDWMHFVSLVIDGFPGFQRREHLKRLRMHISGREALLLRDEGVVVGAAACTRETGSIDFLGVHPQYRASKAARLLLEFMRHNLLFHDEITITTFREGDRADTGQRRQYQQLGFAESEFLNEFGYPTQRLVLKGKERS